jgi:hypothetical protein
MSGTRTQQAYDARQAGAQFLAQAHEAQARGELACAHTWFARAWAHAAIYAPAHALARAPWLPGWLALLVAPLRRPDLALRVARLACARAGAQGRCWLAFTLQLRARGDEGTPEGGQASGYADVWHAMRPFAHRPTGDAWLGAARQARRQMAASARGSQSSVSRLVVTPTTGWPAGLAASMEHVTVAGDARPGAERLSFHLAGEGAWHLTGYVPHPLAYPVPRVPTHDELTP